MLKLDSYSDPKVAAQRRKYLLAAGWKRKTVSIFGVDQERWLAPWGRSPLKIHIAVGQQRKKDRANKA